MRQTGIEVILAMTLGVLGKGRNFHELLGDELVHQLFPTLTIGEVIRDRELRHSPVTRALSYLFQLFSTRNAKTPNSRLGVGGSLRIIRRVDYRLQRELVRLEGWRVGGLEGWRDGEEAQRVQKRGA